MKVRKTGQYNNYAYFAKLDCGVGIALYKCQSCGRYVYVNHRNTKLDRSSDAWREMKANNIDISGQYATNGTESTEKSVTCKICFEKSLEQTWG